MYLTRSSHFSEGYYGCPRTAKLFANVVYGGSHLLAKREGPYRSEDGEDLSVEEAMGSATTLYEIKSKPTSQNEPNARIDGIPLPLSPLLQHHGLCAGRSSVMVKFRFATNTGLNESSQVSIWGDLHGQASIALRALIATPARHAHQGHKC